jgi:hypothetical protein
MRDNPEFDKALANHPGDMYEKLNARSPIDAGGGGEYEVQTGVSLDNSERAGLIC